MLMVYPSFLHLKIFKKIFIRIQHFSTVFPNEIRNQIRQKEACLNIFFKKKITTDYSVNH